MAGVCVYIYIHMYFLFLYISRHVVTSCTSNYHCISLRPKLKHMLIRTCASKSPYTYTSMSISLQTKVLPAISVYARLHAYIYISIYAQVFCLLPLLEAKS